MPESVFDMNLVLKRLRDQDPEIQAAALHVLHAEIKNTQGTIAARTQEFLDMQSSIAECLDSLEDDNRRHLCDLLSVLSVLDEGQACLRYRLDGNITSLFEWTHQYVKKLVKCILDILNGEATAEDYEVLVKPIVEFLMGHNSEVEAIDFVIEVSKVRPVEPFDTMHFAKAISFMTTADMPEVVEAAKSYKNMNIIRRRDAQGERMEYFDYLLELMDDDNRSRVLVYLEEMSEFYNIGEVLARANAFNPSRCLVTLIRYGRVGEAIEYVKGMEDPSMKKQLLYILARNSIYYEGNKDEEYILTNKHLGDILLEVAKSLEVLAPKKLEYLFKGLNKDRIDVSAIANAFVHCGFGRDPVFFPQEGDFKIKDEYAEQLKIYKSSSTMASAGLIHMFNPQGVYDCFAMEIFNEPEIGAALALALASGRMRDSGKSILNILAVFLGSSESKDIIAALTGISILYHGSSDQDVYNLVFPLLSSTDSNISLFSIYTLGCVFTGDMEVLSSCLDVYDELKKELAFSNFAVLGIAMFFYKKPIPFTEYDLEDHSKAGERAKKADKELSKEGSNDTTLESLTESQSSEPVPDDVIFTSQMCQFRRLDKHTKLLSLGLMYIGTGNPAVVDTIFSKALVGEIDALLESLGVLSCCLVGLGDKLAVRLVERITTSSLLLDSSHLRNIVPLCLSFLYASNPRPEVLDLLEKSVNSGEANVNSLVGLGIAGAGTCSSRILRILDANFGNVYKDSRASSALILAQGLVNMGKGLFTLSPMVYDSKLILGRSVLGLLSTIFIFMENGIFKDYPFLIYLLTPAILPKYVSGYDGVVRVGKPVDIVGMVGRPNNISAAIVHSLPIILKEGERAETDDAVCTAFVEDVLVKK
ncbi:26S proteasome regulatory subunit N1 [Pancytospora epiphaga]|nr:26S proteasome regulatory subunit N1 [Pancytospora epiphaga]